ncbi:MAG TPA: hypothetical protein DCO79_10025 [Spirochaeta sp.]|nr:hypothetical protein [Spirochaeta sp.]
MKKLKNKKLSVILFAAAIATFVIILLLLQDNSPGEAELDIYFKASTAYENGNFDASVNLLSAVEKKCPDFYQARLLKGKALFFSGDSVSAATVFTDLLDDVKNYYEVEIWLLRCMIQDSSIGNSVDFGEQLLSRSPEDPRVLGMLGRISAVDGDYQRALELYKRAFLFEEELAINRVDAAKIYFTLMNTDAALAQLEKALELVSENSPLKPAVKSLILQTGASNEE